MRFDLESWARTFLAEDTGADGGGTAVADAPAAEGPASVSDPGEGWEMPDVPAEMADTPDVPAAGDPPPAAPKVDPKASAPVQAHPLAAQAKSRGLSDERIAALGDNLGDALAAMDEMLVAEVRSQRQAAAAPEAGQKPNTGIDKMPKTEPAPQAKAGEPVDLDAIPKELAETFAAEGFDPKVGDMIGKAISKFAEPLLAEVNAARQLLEQYHAAEDQRADAELRSTFLNECRALDPELFGKPGEDIAEGSPAAEALDKAWEYIHDLAFGLKQRGKAIPSVKDVVASAHGALFRDRISKNAVAGIRNSVQRRTGGIRPPQRTSAPAPKNTTEAKAIANISGKLKSAGMGEDAEETDGMLPSF